ncbi:hypothetical protein [Actinomadura rugatobispora]|uniref:Uncharacterized protein n=1 Tax=Actinomadura rugatobispora TaxID=1994 RepID=A0ABW1A398_9ACTN
MEFVVYFLRKVIWTVPDFTVDHYRELHEQIQKNGSFVAIRPGSSSRPANRPDL